MFLVEIFLPLHDNDGAPFAPSHYSDLRRRLVDRFGGLTAFTRSPASGFWEDEGGTARDEIVIFEVMVETLDRSWWRALREELETLFRQDEILIRATPVETL